MKLPRWLPIILIEAILVFLFVYFRLTPIINQTFPYTYDQGRDMLKIHHVTNNAKIELWEFKPKTE